MTSMSSRPKAVVLRSHKRKEPYITADQSKYVKALITTGVDLNKLYQIHSEKSIVWRKIMNKNYGRFHTN